MVTKMMRMSGTLGSTQDFVGNTARLGQPRQAKFFVLIEALNAVFWGQTYFGAAPLQGMDCSAPYKSQSELNFLVVGYLLDLNIPLHTTVIYPNVTP
jgi:hypothetical protein